MNAIHEGAEDQLRRVTQAWAQRITDRLTARERARLDAIGPGDDVRLLDVRDQWDLVSRALLADGGDFGLWVFHTAPDGRPWVPNRSGFGQEMVGNQSLGPLAGLQVYATDPHGECAGQWRGKSHGLCQHQHRLNMDSHKLMSLEEFLPLHQQDPGYRPYTSSGWCSKCGGYALRRLTAEQFDHYADCMRRAHEAAGTPGLR